MNLTTLWILEIFFGTFTFHTTLKYYVKGQTLNWLHTICWYISVLIFAFTSGQLFG